MWYEIKNISSVDSPAVLIFKDRLEFNIDLLISSIDDVNRLRPHIKTHKSQEVSSMLISKGINKFKCATIAEAEILARAGAKDILLAYQPVGPKAKRFLNLIDAYPGSKFSCLIDNETTAHELSQLADGKAPVEYFIDVNVGMNRTGIVVNEVLNLYENIKKLSSLRLRGLHVYDGHLRNPDINVRKRECDEAFASIPSLRGDLERRSGVSLIVIAGGSPTYPIHASRKEVECSPGTFIYWDKGYEQILPEQKFKHAAVVVTRVISKPAPDIVCVDLGHKAIASENPLNNRISFLNADGLEPIGHSEEHMVLKNTGKTKFEIGDVLYGIPYHVCPTIALHDRVSVVINGEVKGTWQTLSRNRVIAL